MEQKTINLEELFEKKGIKNSTSHHNYEYLYKTILEVTKEACRQTLELAAENANMELSNYKGKRYSTHEFIDDHTDIVVNKQSILDTINQIK